MTRFTIEAKTQIFTPAGVFPKGTTVYINLPAPATANTFLTIPRFRDSIISQFHNQGINIAPHQIANGYWKVTDIQK